MVTPAPRGTFSLAAQPSVVETPVGEEAEIQLAVRRIDGFDGPIELTVDAPGDLSADIDPTTLEG